MLTMHGVFAAEPAKLLQFNPLRGLLFVLGAAVIKSAALHTFKLNILAHRSLYSVR